jgi:hypothetical protein
VVRWVKRKYHTNLRVSRPGKSERKRGAGVSVPLFSFMSWVCTLVPVQNRTPVPSHHIVEYRVTDSLFKKNLSPQKTRGKGLSGKIRG